MRKLALIAVLPLTLTAAMCEGTGAFCERVGIISSSPMPVDAQETAENRYDTPATVRRVDQHNRVVKQACGVLPPVPNE